jgi:hypothetical protein
LTATSRGSRSCDRAELGGVAGQHELAAGIRGHLGEPGQALGVGHPRLVHDHDGPRAQGDVAVLDAVAQAVGGIGAVELGVVAQSLRGSAGDGGADHLIALQLPGAGGGGEDDALAGAGAADELRDGTGTGDHRQRLALLLAKRAVDLLADLAARLLQGCLADRRGVLGGRSAFSTVACSSSRRRRIVHSPSSRRIRWPLRASSSTNSSASSGRQAPAASS